MVSHVDVQAEKLALVQPSPHGMAEIGTEAGRAGQQILTPQRLILLPLAAGRFALLAAIGDFS